MCYKCDRSKIPNNWPLSTLRKKMFAPGPKFATYHDNADKSKSGNVIEWKGRALKYIVLLKLMLIRYFLRIMENTALWCSYKWEWLFYYTPQNHIEILD